MRISDWSSGVCSSDLQGIGCTLSPDKAEPHCPPAPLWRQCMGQAGPTDDRPDHGGENMNGKRSLAHRVPKRALLAGARKRGVYGNSVHVRVDLRGSTYSKITKSHNYRR